MQAHTYEIHPILVIIKSQLTNPNSGFLAELNLRQTPEEKSSFINDCKKFVEGNPDPQFTPGFLNNMNNDTEQIFFMRLALMRLVANETRNSDWYQNTTHQLIQDFNNLKFNITFKGTKINKLFDITDVVFPHSSFSTYRYILLSIVLLAMVKNAVARNFSINTQIGLSLAVSAVILLTQGVRGVHAIQRNRLAPFYDEHARQELATQRRNDEDIVRFFLEKPENMPHLQNNR